MDIGSCVEEATDGLDLVLRIPAGTGDESVGCVMEWGASAMVFGRVRIGTRRK
jgi:hypothetical protein